MSLPIFPSAVALLALIAALAAAQPRSGDAGKGSDLFLKAARTLLKWDEPADPFRVVGPVYFVGTKGLGSYLVTGADGHVLINTGMPGSGPMIEKSITALGFKPQDVKVLLAGHAHVDHVGGHAHLHKITGAKVAVVREEKELYASGGALDFQYGGSADFRFDPTPVATVLRDGDEVKVGGVAVKVVLTPGHTRGATTYVTTVTHEGKAYTVVFPDGTAVNPGYRVGRNPSYEGIAADYRRTFRTLAALKPDVWLTPHTDACGLAAKRDRAAKDGVAAWVDPDGYRKWVAGQREAFEAFAKKEADRP